MIVEDQQENRLLLQALLQPYDFELKEAANGQEALELVKEWKPDLILMDRRMPVMDGLETTKVFRKDPSLQDVPIVAVTAHAFHEEQKEMRDAGCSGFLGKPFREAELLQIIGPLLGIQWIYAEEEQEHMEARPLQPDFDAIAVLPQELISVLCQAATEADYGTIMECVDQISDYDQRMASHLRALARAYDYEGLLRILTEGDEPDAK